ncbi:hypothetical protein LX32DRAFT_375744 [Colletotrichum zoysiae]|uniref:Uncharacterized protein n=1 Tax=Colletotrichum zoysiae TaxID=1216348 RepID=A0AAD9M531_9PEZI|nr:hypothetical protein LX32DRAFT_375744 [Colletotrichum zoysiae]
MHVDSPAFLKPAQGSFVPSSPFLFFGREHEAHARSSLPLQSFPSIHFLLHGWRYQNHIMPAKPPRLSHPMRCPPPLSPTSSPPEVGPKPRRPDLHIRTRAAVQRPPRKAYQPNTNRRVVVGRRGGR